MTVNLEVKEGSSLKVMPPLVTSQWWSIVPIVKRNNLYMVVMRATAYVSHGLEHQEIEFPIFFSLQTLASPQKKLILYGCFGGRINGI